MADVLRHEQCPQCAANGNDNSRDNMAVYSDGGKHCFACGYHVHGTEDWEEGSMSVENIKDFSEEAKQKIKDITSTKGKGYRGLDDKITSPFGVRYEYDESTGAVAKQYYPVTINGELSGYKIRKHPKSFLSVGETGRTCDLFGQFKFKQSGKYVLICGGEVDQLSAYQMLREYQLSKAGGEDYAPIAVVSPTIGENCKKQIQKQYDFLNQFERIIVGFDNDDAGRKATEDVIDVLPRGKVWIANWNYKDPNEYLVNGKSREFVRDFYAAKRNLSANILESNGIAEAMKEAAESKKIPLPPFMGKLEELLRGGLPASGIVNLGSASGIGKTSIINQILHHWFFNTDVRAGIVSMELDAGEYGLVLLSHHVKTKIDDMTPEQRMEFMSRPEVLEKQHDLLFRPDGDSRFLLMDDRDGSVEAIKEVVEEMVVAGDCKVIVLDPLQDILDGMSNEEQAVFLKWQKSLVKSHKVLFFNVNHIRKAGSGQDSGSKGAFITEEDFAGSSTIFKSASVNILVSRNKYAEDEVERNTSIAYCSKNRKGGRTGPCGEWYYDHDTHTLFDKDYYFTHVEPPQF